MIIRIFNENLILNESLIPPPPSERTALLERPSLLRHMQACAPPRLALAIFPTRIWDAVAGFLSSARELCNWNTRMQESGALAQTPETSSTLPVLLRITPIGPDHRYMRYFPLLEAVQKMLREFLPSEGSEWTAGQINKVRALADAIKDDCSESTAAEDRTAAKIFQVLAALINQRGDTEESELKQLIEDLRLQLQNQPDAPLSHAIQRATQAIEVLVPISEKVSSLGASDPFLVNIEKVVDQLIDAKLYSLALALSDLERHPLNQIGLSERSLEFRLNAAQHFVANSKNRIQLEQLYATINALGRSAVGQPPLLKWIDRRLTPIVSGDPHVGCGHEGKVLSARTSRIAIAHLFAPIQLAMDWMYATRVRRIAAFLMYLGIVVGLLLFSGLQQQCFTNSNVRCPKELLLRFFPLLSTPVIVFLLYGFGQRLDAQLQRSW
jgi:hypothetical protein